MQRLEHLNQKLFPVNMNYLETSDHSLYITAAGHVDVNAIHVSDSRDGARKRDVQSVVVVTICSLRG